MPLPPNILWIVTTQWRAQACGYAGDPNARTPCLDALAAESVNYTQAVTPHPFGPFARAALLTGVPSPENGVRDYFDPLPLEARTIAHEMMARGYATAFFGKWHLAPRDPHAPLVGEAHARTIVPPERRGGFEVWDGFESGFQLNDPWLHGRWNEIPQRQSGYQSDVVCARASDYLSEAAHDIAERDRRGKLTQHLRRPYFMVVSLEPPHPPYDAPAGRVARRSVDSLVLPANVPGEAEAKARGELAGYHAHIEATDRAIGQILLPQVGEDTVVVFTSVHGDMHGAHGLFRKGWPQEESIRVPLLVRLPAAVRTECGVRSAELVSLLDLPRWTMAWADGQQLEIPHATLETGETLQRISMPSVVALPHQCERVWRGVRTATRKLVLNADGSPWLFFDLERDPLERENLVGVPSRAAEIAALRARCE